MALCLAPSVREAVTVVRGESSDKQLVAYVVGDNLKTDIDSNEPQIRAIKVLLTSQLPSYMVPNLIIVLNEIPLSANGKLDRKALPAVDLTSQQGVYEAPETAEEYQLVEFWSALLKLPVEQLGRSADFFELGGHSLLAAKLVAKLRSEDKQLSVRDIFEAPKLAEQAARIQSLTEQEDNIQVVARQADELLSFAQKRLWFLAELEGASATYNIPLALQLSGRLNVEALKASLHSLVERHEILRTRYYYHNDEPRQKIESAALFKLQQEVLTGLAEEARSDAIASAMTMHAETPFDIKTELPFKASLLQLAEEEHVLLICMHHIASDGWSLEIFNRELMAGYQSACKGSVMPLAPSLQYIDYAHWQRQWLAGERETSQLQYWGETLAGLPPLLELPTDRIRPAVQNFAGACYEVELSAALVKQLSDIGQSERASLFMTLLTAFNVLLAKYSGQNDIAVGTPVANRPRDELEDVIGLFTNTLVLRNQVEPEQNLRTLLQQVRETTLSAYAHQDLPFEHLVEALQPERSLSHSPLFQVMFSLQHAGQDAVLNIEGCRIQPLSRKHSIAKFDLSLHLELSNAGLKGYLEYNTNLFDESTIARLWHHFQVILQQTGEMIDNPVERLNVIDATEHKRQVYQWNQTQIDYPKNICIHQQFEQQVLKSPEAIAIEHLDQTLTFSELNNKANELAAILRQQGVTTEITVGVCMPRTPELIIAILAIVKAGGAYVPMDPKNPEERLQYMINNSGVKLVITNRRQLNKSPVLKEKALLFDELTCAKQLVDIEINIASENLAYVIYTSGSTGQAKGVMNSHKALSNLCHWHINTYELDSNSRGTHLASIGFDAAVWEIWPYLLAGASIVLVSDETREDPKLLSSFLIDNKVSHCFMPTGLLEMVAGCHGLESEYLKVLLTGGDKLSYYCLPVKSNTQLINHYGPTEAAVVTTCHKVSPDNIGAPAIGKPMNNSQVYVMNDGLEIQPVGVVGELYIGGDNLARGYLDKADLTAEKFIPHPFSDTPGARLYRSGDQVRYRSDGELEYVGRIDHQVKLRGFRIELGEIDWVLSQVKAVRESITIIHGDSSAKHIVSYVVCDKSEFKQFDYVNEIEQVNELLLQNINSSISTKLPDYMMPSLITILDEMPLTSNGKLDKQALPEPDLSQYLGEYEAPVGSHEKLLVGNWSALLDIPAEQIGRNTNFFKLGGHSLLAAKLVAQLQSESGLILSVRDIFEAPLLTEQAARMQQQKNQSNNITVVARREYEPLSYAQKRLWFLEQFEGASATYNIPVVMRLKGALNQPALISSLTNLLTKHKILTTQYIEYDGEPCQVVHAVDSFELVQQNFTKLGLKNAMRLLNLRYLIMPKLLLILKISFLLESV